jgi:hypothetical protein
MTRGATWLLRAVLGATLPTAPACAPIPEPRVLVDVAAVRRSPSVAEARRHAPAAVARADALADQARRVLDEGDTGAEAAAQHVAEEALASYEIARATAREVVAERRRADAAARRDVLAKEKVALDDELARQSADVAALERELAVLTELELPAASGPASAEREAARRVASRSLALDARLFCVAASLLGAESATVDPALAEVAAVDEALSGRGPTPIDRAARVRARCLEVLTAVRRRAAPTAAPAAPAAEAPTPAPAEGARSAPDTSADALLAALSAAGREPSRDERGVVVVLRDAFDGTALSKGGAARLAELDRVAAAHPAFPVLVVVHDARAGKDEDPARGRARAAAAAAAFPSAGPRVRGEHAGAAAPLVDPKGSRAARNARLEVVFVAPSSI